ncbi:Hypothetical protein, putative peptidase S8/S53 [Metamycoplasma alkalescens 14918]|uniref:Peptidase S8/S53 domain-containing protein n=1 Tax=Metamycoplasma alkalescens 14918 TaxID=1188234 RepID=N9TZI5_9BACT|nr:S8 family peptidase [Metamycoplasma alkalescens]ENY53707.1 Hypothetical protein, putative peptidase S8/S53 [Metamycoplasma alkalescens 14918]
MKRNKIIKLTGKFNSAEKRSQPGPVNIRNNSYVKLDNIIKIKEDLEKVIEFWKNFWKNQKLEIKPLVSCYYNDVIAKSNRVKGIFYSDINSNNNAIVGAKFLDEKIGEKLYKKHVIIYLVDMKNLLESKINLEKVIDIIYKNFGDKISHEDIKNINENKYNDIFNLKNSLSKSKFVRIVVDCYYLDGIKVDQDVQDDFVGNSLVTIYKTGTNTRKILDQLKINSLNTLSNDEITLLLTPDNYQVLKKKAPFLIAMGVNDITKFETEDFVQDSKTVLSIKDPENEPIIGVIDTMFDTNTYFSKWVEFHNMLNIPIPLDKKDFIHGTAVSSIIVDGHRLNLDLDDGCGNFRVRHFGVVAGNQGSSYTIINLIEEIIQKNSDIKVWNLSLGSDSEINKNFISIEAAKLDKIQFENDVIFVVSGTNKKVGDSLDKKIGSPADSINSIVVNSVDSKFNPANYSRSGEVLSFFNKPDISYYGGTSKEPIRVCRPDGEAFIQGTSYAAPWIARKLAYLIHKIGFNKEIAKALIIHSAIRSVASLKNLNKKLIGFGVVPIRIEDILSSRHDEIRIVITGITNDYEIYTHNIPVPHDDNVHPFVASATLCYFPNCDRNQGVDYTNTEMDIHFGPVYKKNKKKDIKSINENKQDNDEKISLFEGSARYFFRKWDNIKHIEQYFYTKSGNKRKPKKLGYEGCWGIKIKTKERLNNYDGKGLKFGLVITLKEINGINRLQAFIDSCELDGLWVVEKIDVKNMLDIYEKLDDKLFE